MLVTDLKKYEKELKEVCDLFNIKDDLRIRHLYKKGENKVVNTVVVDGKAYAYGNLLSDNLDAVIYKRLEKRFAKLSLYKALSSYFNVSLPWGALTGIRPTKLAYRALESDGEFKSFFVDDMKVSKEKTELVERVIKSQEKYYVKDKSNCDLFVFIPFCPSRCKYCSFICSDIKSATPYVDMYVDYLCKDIENAKGLIKSLRSIYIGGGTPVSLSNENLDRILTAIDKINTGVEYTVEAGRPDRITPENIKIFKDHGVNRICVNPQTFNDFTLKKIGRNHTGEDILKAYELVKKDFSVNMDLIAGLEGETFEDFKFSLDKTFSLSPDNITVHTLCLKRGSYLADEKSEIFVGETGKMVDYASETLINGGYNPYYLYRQRYMAGNLENVGYTKTGKECVFNIDTMEEISDCIACGANGISKRINGDDEKIERYAFPKDVKSYIENFDLNIKKRTNLFEKN